MNKNLVYSVPGTGKVLLLILLVAILPVAAVITFRVPVPFILAVAVGYVLQIVIVFGCMVRWRVFPPLLWAVFSMIYCTVQLLTASLTTIEFGVYELGDIVAAVAKALGLFVFAGLATTFRASERELSVFLSGFLWIAFLAVIANVVMNGSDFGKILSVSSSYELDFSSFFANRNQFGSFLFLSIVVHFLYLQGKKLRGWNIVFLFMQITSLLLTMSRGAMLAFVFFIVCLAVLHLIRKPRYLVLLVSIVFSVFLVLSKSGLIVEFNRVFLRPENGLSGRNSLWELGLKIWSENNLLFGVGSFSGVRLAHEQGMPFAEFHNFIVETLISGGVIEFLLLAAIIGLVWSRLAKSSLDNDRRYVLYSGGLGIVGLSMVESVSLFNIGLVSTLFSIFVVTLPIWYANLPGETVRDQENESNLIKK